MRLAGICKDCIKRLGVDERLTVPLQFIQVSQLPEYDPKSMAGVQYPSSSGIGRGGHQGTTKITYKIAKTVKETIDDASSHGSHTSQSSRSSLPGLSRPKSGSKP